MTSLVLGETLKVFSTVRRSVQFAGYFKMQAHCLRLGRLAPLRLTFGGIQNRQSKISYLPFQTGGRFSTKAFGPSLASSVCITMLWRSDS
jgi:hypothetical protein